MAAAYGRRLSKEWRSLKTPADGAQVGVVVTPWMFTPAPFFAIECGLALAEAGCRVTWLWDAGDVFLNAGKPREIVAIDQLFGELPNGLKRVSVHETVSDDHFDDAQFLKLLIYENAVRELRGEVGVLEFLAQNQGIPAAMEQHVSKVNSVLINGSFDWLFIPGGVWASSGLYARMAERLGIDYTSYDSGPGELFVSKNGPAAHFPDVGPALAELRDLSITEREILTSAATENLRLRMKGEDEYRLQPKPSGSDGTQKCDILLPLNYRADTAALCRQKVFGSVLEWVVAVCTWIEAHPPYHLVIRQHPCERIPEYRGTDNWELHLGKFPSFGNRIHLVKAEADVNTYDLLSRAKVVLPFTSRVGIEAAMMLKPVILGSQCYYAGCGFTADAKSSGEYFVLLEKALTGELPTDQRQADLAGLCYYIAERCLSLRTSFTPQPGDFIRWVAHPRSVLWSERPQQAFLSMMLARENSALAIERLINRQAAV